MRETFEVCKISLMKFLSNRNRISANFFVNNEKQKFVKFVLRILLLPKVRTTYQYRGKLQLGLKYTMPKEIISLVT